LRKRRLCVEYASPDGHKSTDGRIFELFHKLLD
jgi:hypothetical protein